MADGGPPAPQPSPVVPPALSVQPPVPLTQLRVPPVQPIAPPIQPIQPRHMPQLSWLHFKPEFAGKPDKDVEARLHRTNEWRHIARCQCLMPDH